MAGVQGHESGIGVAAALLAGLLAIALTVGGPAPPRAAAADAEASARIRGIDVSRFQGRIDWAQVSTTKTAFVYTQASRGSGRDCLVVPERCGADETYRDNYRGARAHGIPVGAYHRAFAAGRTRARVKADAKAEAKLFATTVGKLRRGDLVPALDVESPFKNMDEAGLRLWIKTWLTKVERKLGAKPIIYTNNNSWLATGDTQRFAKRGYKLWVANFDVPSPLVPAANWAGRGYKIWQHTSSGKVRGINGNVDKNKLSGGLRKLTAR